jgi:hypothetical protein
MAGQRSQGPNGTIDSYASARKRGGLDSGRTCNNGTYNECAQNSLSAWNAASYSSPTQEDHVLRLYNTIVKDVGLAKYWERGVWIFSSIRMSIVNDIDSILPFPMN